MTEDEAREKWCPFAYAPTTLHVPQGSGAAGVPDLILGVSGNRGTAMKMPLLTCKCVASDCMAWRWIMKDAGKPPHPMMAQYPPYEPDYQPTEQGYCGLARTP